MYKILVVDDSALMRKVICDIINADSDFRVVDVSADGEDAYNKIKNNSYDVVVLDMILPKMTAVQILAKLSEERVPFNVVLISSSIKEDADSTVRAMELGALDFVVKPIRTTPASMDDFVNRLLVALRNVAKLSSSRARLSRLSRPASTAHLDRASERTPISSGTLSNRAATTSRTAAQRDVQAKAPVSSTPVTKGKKIIALACSTGGPQALHTFVPMLPADLKYPLVLVQHMPAGFTASLAARLDQISAITVKEATEGEFLKPGHVYIAPGGKHMEICENASRAAYCHLNDGPPVNSLKPCADVMYESLSDTSFEEVICVVLTGMGADGTEGIDCLKKTKRTYVISQEASTCVVYGMPKSVEQKGLSNEVVPLNLVADSIVKKIGGL